MTNDDKRAWWMTGFGLALALVTILTAGCSYDGEAWQGQPLGGKLDLHSSKEGVYPDKSVLVDPNNPFAVGTLPQEVVWELQTAGDPVVSFYAWATLNARGATGERQYYTALNLKAIFDGNLMVEEDMSIMKDVAIAAFNAQLEHFPDARSYSSDGSYSWDLATLSLQAVLDLGGQPPNGWILVETETGPKAVRQ